MLSSVLRSAIQYSTPMYCVMQSNTVLLVVPHNLQVSEINNGCPKLPLIVLHNLDEFYIASVCIILSIADLNYLRLSYILHIVVLYYLWLSSVSSGLLNVFSFPCFDTTLFLLAWAYITPRIPDFFLNGFHLEINIFSLFSVFVLILYAVAPELMSKVKM